MSLAPQANRLHPARVRMTGPCVDPVLETQNGRTAITIELALGEQVELVVPLADRPPLASLPAFRSEAGESVEFIAWEPTLALDPGVAARARPPLGEAVHPLAPAALLCTLAGLVLALALRRRPVVAVLSCLGLGIAAAVTQQAHTGAVSRPPIVVLEATRSLPEEPVEWTAVASWFEQLELTSAEPAQVRTRPADASLEWAVLPPAVGGRSVAWVARAEGAALDHFSDYSAPGELGPAGNGWGGELRSAWTRAAGAWSAHGAWPRGGGLPPARSGLAAPPGWLVSRLPQGPGVLVADAGNPPPAGGWGGPADVRAWIRLVGFGP